MTSYFRCMFLAILCVSMAACGKEQLAYTHPSIPDADDSEVAIFEDDQFFGLLRRIVDADGNEISYLQPSKYPVVYIIRLPPGKYKIYYRSHGVARNSRVTLEAGHLYEVENSLWSEEDAWIQDVTTDEPIGGCRQEMGCIPDSW